MKKLLALLLIVFALLLVACGGGTTTTAPAEPAVQPAAPEPAAPEPAAPEPAAPEPAAEPAPAEPAPFTEADKDAAFKAFLGRMVAYNTIRPADLNEKLVEGTPPFILDVREPSEVEEKGHIEGAVHIPLRKLAQNLDLLPSFDTPIVAYCGIGWRCTIAMTQLGALGWTDVKALIGGSFGGWVEAGFPVVAGLPPAAEALNAAEPNPGFVAHANEVLTNLPEGWGVITPEQLFTELVEKPNLILIDVRTQANVDEQGIIEHPNQLLIPLEQFIDLKSEWPADKNAEIVTYCATGHRCTMAMTILYNYGYTNVRSLKGGLNAWLAAGYPVLGGTAVAPTPTFTEADLDAAFEAFLGRMVAYNTIRPDALNTLIVEDNAPFILDVRQPSELEEKGHIEGAVNIPLRDLAKNLNLLPSFDTPIVAYCGIGWRCTIAMTQLGALGWTDVKALVGGSFGGWVEAGFPVVAGPAAAAEALNAAEPNPEFVAHSDQVLTNLPEGWGVITPEQLSTELLDKPNLILIDVRKVSEAEENGIIEHGNQLLIPLEEFIKNKDQWPTDKDAEIVTYCGTGHRCTMAMTILFNYGYTNVRSLKGGLGAWVAAGFPVVEYVAP